MSHRKVAAFVGIIFVTSLVFVVKLFDIQTITLASICDTSIMMKLVEQQQQQQQQQQLMKNETLYKHHKQQATITTDVTDNSLALGYLTQHSRRFKPTNFKLSVEPDPNKPETITTWWQGLAMVDWYLGAPVRYICKKKVPMGNWLICQDEPYTVKPPCLVYSFGINWEFQFDDAMAKLGCEVHLFDPSMKEKDHKRGNNSTFHNMGIGSYNTDAFVPRHDGYVKDRQTWKVRTVKAIMKELGHENRVIDVFKMDVESYEWTVIDNMLETDVFQFIRQFDLEYHVFKDFPLPEEYVHLYQVYTRLRELGFREYYSLKHQRHVDNADEIRLQADVCYVNVFFDKNIIGR